MSKLSEIIKQAIDEIRGTGTTARAIVEREGEGWWATLPDADRCEAFLVGMDILINRAMVQSRQHARAEACQQDRVDRLHDLIECCQPSHQSDPAKRARCVGSILDLEDPARRDAEIARRQAKNRSQRARNQAHQQRHQRRIEETKERIRCQVLGGIFFKGADGRVKSLLEFTPADHEYREGVCKSYLDGFQAKVEWHQKARALMEKQKAGTMENLSPSSLLELDQEAARAFKQKENPEEDAA